MLRWSMSRQWEFLRDVWRVAGVSSSYASMLVIQSAQGRFVRSWTPHTHSTTRNIFHISLRVSSLCAWFRQSVRKRG